MSPVEIVLLVLAILGGLFLIIIGLAIGIHIYIKHNIELTEIYEAEEKLREEKENEQK